MFLAAYTVTWVIVHGKIASPIVERWQYRWEDRWIKKHAGVNEAVAARMWDTDGWNSRLAYLPTCAWCTGFWVSGALIAMTYPFAEVPLWPLTWLAMTAVVGLLDSLMHREA
jgi:hypothetical protein